MKPNRLLLVLLILLSNAAAGFSDVFDQVASGKTTNSVLPKWEDTKSFDEIKAAAEKGDADAEFKLGMALSETNAETAIQWLTKAAKQNNAPAFNWLAWIYNKTNTPFYKPALALSFKKKAAEAGNGNDQYYFGRNLLEATYGERDVTNGIYWIERGLTALSKSANTNDSFWFELDSLKYAELCMEGKLVPQNISNAVFWCEQSLRGDIEMAAIKGKFYGHYRTNWLKAEMYFRVSAGKEDPDALYMLGYIYANGLTGQTNIDEAIQWFRRAAEAGDKDAQYNLGVIYENGQGVAIDRAESVKWYRMAAEQDDPSAQANLGGSYVDGTGVEQDYIEAAKWLRKAAEQGNAQAQRMLGALYANGNGVPQNFVDAYKWSSLGAAQGDKYAVTNRNRIMKWMTQKQIADAQELSREFKPRKASNSNDSNSDKTIADYNPTATGTGFFITDDGYLISNYHVVKGAAKVRLLTGAGLIDASVVKVDAANDLALLKANAEGRMQNAETFKPLPIAASRTVKLGGTVATVGFPDIGLQGFSPKLAKGEIASLSGAADDPRYFQISLPVQHGNSGGALVDVHGNVVGIVAARLGVEIGKAVTSDELPENVNYAVKSSLLLSFLESVPDVAAKLKEPNVKDESFEEVVKSAQAAAVLVLVY